ncbi:hypothetical protein [Pseudobutyrivibrio sp.]|uniref:hypothetical protein n=1 Tax=Pseudobutyrivibrio sp. TaxID=2014367 RepID=UPI001D46F460|nr:hypothetical protein [Pseudobutyrivibrio sp.]MBE5910823.1 hypothetical protein [Pseudobutyrivibrio sp.]
MTSRDLYLSMVGIDDVILAKASRPSKNNKVIKFHKRLSFVAGICLALIISATAVAAIRHFWGRGMSGYLKSTDEQQQTLTETGQAIVYPELTDYSSYQITDQGVTIAPNTVVVGDDFAYISFTVSGFEVGENEEPAAELDYYLGDNPSTESSWVNGSSSFYDGLIIDDKGYIAYADGSEVKIGDDGNTIRHYYDEDGNLEYIIQIQAIDGVNTILGNTLHVNFTDLGIYPGNADYQSYITGNWDFTLKLPTVSNTQNIKVNKEVPGTNFTVESIDISPVSITVNYKVNGEVNASEDCLGMPEFTGFVLEDGTRLPYVANGGSSGFTDETEKYAVCSRAFDRVIDISQVKSILLWPDDFGGCDMVEVEIQ